MSGIMEYAMSDKKGWRPTLSNDLVQLEAYRVWLLEGQKDISGRQLVVLLAEVNRRIDLLTYG
jgi:hypothetical protein